MVFNDLWDKTTCVWESWILARIWNYGIFTWENVKAGYYEAWISADYMGWGGVREIRVEGREEGIVSKIVFFRKIAPPPLLDLKKKK